MRTPDDLAGKHFGDLTVLGRIGPRWVVRCRCGVEKTMTRGNLTRPGTQSCGCKGYDPRLTPEPPPVAGARWIALTQGRFALVDDDSTIAALVVGRWQALKSRHTWYARKASRLMHRLIVAPIDPDAQVDHIDGNGLNNRRSNLRICTAFGNHQNTPKPVRLNATSSLKGVSFCKHTKRWKARIVANGEIHWLGRFDSEADAALAYDAAAAGLHGQFARLNGPGS